MQRYALSLWLNFCKAKVAEQIANQIFPFLRIQSSVKIMGWLSTSKLVESLVLCDFLTLPRLLAVATYCQRQRGFVCVLFGQSASSYRKDMRMPKADFSAGKVIECRLYRHAEPPLVGGFLSHMILSHYDQA